MKSGDPGIIASESYDNFNPLADPLYDNFFSGRGGGPESAAPTEFESEEEAWKTSEPWVDNNPWEYEPQPQLMSDDGYDASRRIYLLGAGSLGCLVAHSLRAIINPPPVTVLLRNRKRLVAWQQNKRRITVISSGKTDSRSDFDAEVVRQMKDEGNMSNPQLNDDAPILNLIVTVKAGSTVDALRNIAHRLRPESTICFLQNGMGAIDEVINGFFPDASTRPTLIAGVVHHGLYTSREFQVEHRGKGSILLSILDRLPRQQATSSASEDIESFLPDPEPRSLQPYWSHSARYMMRTLTRSHTLSGIGIKSGDLILAQLEKLAMNAIINPLTAIFGCKNGELLMNRSMQATMRLLIAEISLVLRSLPELHALFPVPGAQMYQGKDIVANVPKDVHWKISSRLDARRIEESVLDLAKKTGENESSMYVDVQRGRPTEIDYINGYIIKRGEELGVKCIVNYMIVNMVAAKQTLQWRRERNLGFDEDWSSLSEDVKQILDPPPSSR